MGELMGLLDDGASFVGGRHLRARLAGLLLAFLCACDGSQQEILNAELLDGRVVQEFLAPDRPTVVLVYDAGTCIWCATPLRHWEQVARTGKAEVVLLLTGPIRDDDQRTLTIRRIRVGGRLAPSATSKRRGSAPVGEYIIAERKVVDSATGVREISRRRLWSHPLFTSAALPVPGASQPSGRTGQPLQGGLPNYRAKPRELRMSARGERFALTFFLLLDPILYARPFTA